LQPAEKYTYTDPRTGLRKDGLIFYALGDPLSWHPSKNSRLSATTKIKPKQTHYDSLEIDEFWTYVWKKKNKIWLIYAYHRESGEILAFVWGKRDLKTAKKSRNRIKRLGISCDRIATDNWESSLSAFREDRHEVGKEYTVGKKKDKIRLIYAYHRESGEILAFVWGKRDIKTAKS
jgi:IS1 family transposase